MNLEFCRQIFEIHTSIKYNKIRQVGAELFHVERRKDRQDEANSRFPQFLKSS
jgi:hypothetical protein